MTFFLQTQSFVFWLALYFHYIRTFLVIVDTLKIRVIKECEFHRGTNATQTARNIKNVYGENCTNERTNRYWFSRLRPGNFDLKNEARGRPKTLVNNNELKAIIVEADKLNLQLT